MHRPSHCLECAASCHRLQADCVARCGYTVYPFGYEYLGNTPRLVVTPLTERAFSSMMAAVHLHYGGAPEGPAGVLLVHAPPLVCCVSACVCEYLHLHVDIGFAHTVCFTGLIHCRLHVVGGTAVALEVLMVPMTNRALPAPRPPAPSPGTGKTETVKELARCLGKQCVVFNTTEQLEPGHMTRLLMGVISTGAWACFDEFNRMDMEVRFSRAWAWPALTRQPKSPFASLCARLR
jgi:hypothetical protein